MKKIISWNGNGIRAAAKKGLLEWLQETQPDILCLQEIKIQEDQLTPALRSPEGYTSIWATGKKKGYSGVAAYVKKKPLKTALLNIEEFDNEGRAQVLEYSDFTLVNCYFPNSQLEGKRLNYKLDFCTAILKFCKALRMSNKSVIICGDFNIAHKAIDLKDPEKNENSPGYFPEERAWMGKFLEEGYLDTFRMFNSDPGHYTWWSYRQNARKYDAGWRIDYHCVDPSLKKRVKKAEILKKVMGSDHCPVLLQLA